MKKYINVVYWQRENLDTVQSWQEYAESAQKWERIGRRYGLMREFHENGIC